MKRCPFQNQSHEKAIMHIQPISKGSICASLLYIFLEISKKGWLEWISSQKILFAITHCFWKLYSASVWGLSWLRHFFIFSWTVLCQCVKVEMVTRENQCSEIITESLIKRLIFHFNHIHERHWMKSYYSVSIWLTAIFFVCLHFVFSQTNHIIRLG